MAKKNINDTTESVSIIDEVVENLTVDSTFNDLTNENDSLKNQISVLIVEKTSLLSTVESLSKTIDDLSAELETIKNTPETPIIIDLAKQSNEVNYKYCIDEFVTVPSMYGSLKFKIIGQQGFSDSGYLYRLHGGSHDVHLEHVPESQLQPYTGIN